MLRRFFTATHRSQFASAACAFPRCYVTDAAEAEPTPATPHTLQKMWALWNEGNLFSLTPGDLTNFLKTQQITIDPKWKKAALVRQVEELLQANEQKAKSTSKPSATQNDQYGGWDKDAAAKSEMLLDLSQAGFYQGEAQTAPRAFQLLVDDVSLDYVVSRVNTTAFPGFPASTECYTLTAADADQAARARFIKTLKWCAINLKTLSMDGQIHVDLGKLVLLPQVIKKNNRVLSAWTLQQRLQVTAPYHWVSSLSPDFPSSIDAFTAANGFEQNGNGKSKLSYDVTIRKDKKVAVEIQLNSKGAVVSVNRAWERLQSSHFTRTVGPDIRFLFRARRAVAPEEADKFTKLGIVDVTGDNIKILLPPEHGEVIYCSENDVRTWSKPIGGGGVVTLTEIKRQPLVVARDEEEGERVEYSLEVDVPRTSGDVSDAAGEVYKLARALAAASQDKFVAAFGTEAQAPTLDDE